jgi:predicted enzyme related to lactoylglutathione lyase
VIECSDGHFEQAPTQGPFHGGGREARMIHGSMFVLAVPDLQRSGAFYRDVLGFEVREMGDPGWRMFVADGCCIMAGACPGAMPAAELGDHSYFGYLVVDDADAYYRRAQAHAAEIVKPIASEPWGMREFGLRTVDGHRLMVGQRLPP